MGGISDLDIDDGLLQDFLDESIDLLSEIDSLFVKLEASPQDLEIVNAIFRPIHSVKGNAPFFGYTKLRNLAHEMETILALVRDRSIIASEALIGVLLEGTDEIKSMLSRVKSGGPEVIDEDNYKSLVEKTAALASSTDNSPEENWALALESLEILRGKLPEDLSPDLEQLDSILSKLCPIKKQSQGTEAAQVHGPEAFKYLKVLVSKDWEAIEESQFAEIHTQLEALSKLAKHDETVATVTTVCESFSAYVGSIGMDELLFDMIKKAVDEFEETEDLGAEPEVTAKPVESQIDSPAGKAESAVGDKQAPAEVKKVETSKSMRVSEDHIDTFLSHIGELFIVGELLSYLERKLILENVGNELLKEYRNVIESFSALSHNLQHSVMSIRRVTVKTLTQKVPRLVRDIASERGKKIDVIKSGEDIEIDKSLIELLDAPITHMVRNAADHGIESPEERAEAGKDPTGQVRVDVTEDDKYVIVEISDDGRGLNYEAIQSKAETLGLIAPGQQLTNDAIVSFLFAAGVSTAEKVTDVSGRGVGMDVVRRAIEEAGGEIMVNSESGKGACFTIMLPKAVTTQILEGLIFDVAGQCFVVPLDKVNEAFACSESDFFSATGEDRYLFRNNEMIPLVPAREMLRSGKVIDNSSDESAHIVSVVCGKKSMGVWVDSILGVQQVVVKDIIKIGGRDELYVGGALMGDGRIALILDIESLCSGYDENDLAARGQAVGLDEGDEASKENQVNGTLEELLIARVGEDMVAISLELVNRLEKFDANQIEFSGGDPVVQYRGGILPICDLTALLRQEKTDHGSELSVVVYNAADKLVGFLVDEIYDVVSEVISLERFEGASGIKGTAIIKNKITTVLDLDQISL